MQNERISKQTASYKYLCVFLMATDNDHISTILSWLDENPCFYATPLGQNVKI